MHYPVWWVLELPELPGSESTGDTWSTPQSPSRVLWPLNMLLTSQLRAVWCAAVLFCVYPGAVTRVCTSLSYLNLGEDEIQVSCGQTLANQFAILPRRCERRTRWRNQSSNAEANTCTAVLLVLLWGLRWVILFGSMIFSIDNGVDQGV